VDAGHGSHQTCGRRPHSRIRATAQFFTDCTNNTLAQVSFITEAPPYDEHPDADVRTGMQMIESIVQAVQQSAAWSSTAILITYDEAGGFSTT
jgi:phospholipase C